MSLVRQEAARYKILLVEDSEDDALITQKALQRAQVPARVQWVKSGEECLAFLRQNPPYQDAERPDLVLLDLKLPLMDGRAVMREIVIDPELQTIPVIVLSTSQAPDDIADMYRLRCNSYIVKSMEFAAFVRTISVCSQYWFGAVELPVVDA
ncbi:MAG: two-component system response regulator [Pirellulaceae bacterium]|nr:MAG: two-component system response regulator [Pirellulaceae bacterium]